MSAIDKEYGKLLREIKTFGQWVPTRTGVDALSIPSAVIRHDMMDGFPILSGKKTPFGVIKTELEGFLKGVTDKRWYQERKCHIWDEWCNPMKVPYGKDEESQRKMKAEPDLGPIYGAQWRNFGGGGTDQIFELLQTLKKDPSSRRMIVSAWNPNASYQMALVPCHYSWQVLVHGNTLHLNWNQRSVDTFLGLPFNIASYALLLEMLAKEFGFNPGQLTGFLGDTHIYENQMPAVETYLARDVPVSKPELVFNKGFKGINEFTANHVSLKDYDPMPHIPAPIAV